MLPVDVCAMVTFVDGEQEAVDKSSDGGNEDNDEIDASTVVTPVAEVDVDCCVNGDW